MAATQGGASPAARAFEAKGVASLVHRPAAQAGFDERRIPAERVHAAAAEKIAEANAAEGRLKGAQDELAALFANVKR